MNPNRLLNQTATVTHATADGAVDAFGDPTETTTTADYRCWLSKAQRSEDTANANSQQERWTLYLDSSADGEVDGGDAVTVAGVAYELDGPPWPAVNPRTGQVSHLEASLRRTR